MDRLRLVRHTPGLLATLVVALSCGCQTVKTDESKIANSNLPREFAMVTMPDYVVEPPDLLLVEVLEALPGRPISGERLVKPDGKVTLGFYGEVYVAGLTTDEIKEKVVLHLRKYLPDDLLGLNEFNPKTGKIEPIEPRDTNRVFVDVAAYNSKFYYVEGDVASPGKLPITGKENVLDAIHFAGGLIPQAAPNNIRLVRPSPPGACCEQTLPVNLSAIVNVGDSTTNYQLMPGDRLVVYRDPIIRGTIFIDRLAAPFQTVVNSVLQYSLAARSAKSINIGLFGTGTATGTTGTTTRTLPIQAGAR